MADIKVNVKTTWGKKEKKSSIKINAKTLGGAAKELAKRDEWGEFSGRIDYSYDSDENDYVTDVTLKPYYTINMPVWSGYKKAPKACQEEWDRMWKALDAHEEGHRLIHLETLIKITERLEKQTNLTVDDLKIHFAELIQEGQDNQDKFDAATGHGSKKGVSLQVTPECE